MGDELGGRLTEPGQALDTTLHAATPSNSSSSGSTDTTPRQIGRFIILARVGEGGMGVVYSAWDPELDRRVALKLLHGGSGIERQERLVREAKAMAKLTHPNVVTVYEARAVGERLYIAMEYIEGTTLTRWQAQPGRSWKDVLNAYIDAGHGLAAAHSAGLVHRDFKPDNVLVDNYGRVRVTDFGLARAFENLAEKVGLDSGEIEYIPAISGLDERLTRVGAVVGTPAYMSPEQLHGKDVDLRTDIFSYCIALWEGLYGERPFEGETLPSLVANVLSGTIRRPQSSRVPAGIRNVLTKGLAVEAEQRWVSMDALLGAFKKSSPWLRILQIVAVLVVLTTVATLVWSLQRQRTLEVEREATRCSGVPQVGAVYNADRSDAIEAAFAATKTPFAGEAATAVQRRLDAYAEELEAAYRGTCEDHRGDGLTDNLYERSQICLDAGLLALGALAQVFTDADATVVEDAVKALGTLPRLDVCRDRSSLALQVRPPDEPAAAKAVQRLRETLAWRRAGLSAGKIIGCVDDLAPLHREAADLAHPPILAETAAILSLCEELSGEYEPAETHLLEALSEATASTMDAQVAADAATRMIRILGLRRGHYADARRWAVLASALVRRRGDLPEEVGRIAGSLATLDLLEGRPAEALTGYDRALERLDAAFGPTNIETLSLLNNRSAALNTLGRYAEVQANLEDVAGRTRELLGPRHPSLPTILSNLGNSRLRQGEIEAAIAVQREAIALKEENLGPENPELATFLTALGEGLSYAGQLDEAEASYERALSLRVRALGAEHPSVADANLWLGNLHVIWREDPARGRPYLERAFALYQRQLPPEHPRIATTMGLLGRVDVLTGNRGAGLATLEAALTIAAQGKGLAEDDAELQFFLAKTLWAEPQERPRARSLAESAAAGFGSAGPLYVRYLAEVENWLSEHSADDRE